MEALAVQLQDGNDQHVKSDKGSYTDKSDSSSGHGKGNDINTNISNGSSSNDNNNNLSWAENYALERTKTPATPVIQNLLHKKHMERLQGKVDDDDDDVVAHIRSRRATAGVKCPSCGRVGYYRINCPSCQANTPVTIDIVNDSWRPITPDDVRQQKLEQDKLEDPVYQMEQAKFKKESEVKTKTGLGNASWFWKKDDFVWQYYDEPLPEAYDNKREGKVGRALNARGGGGILDFSTASVDDVMSYYNATENKAVASGNTFIPGKLKTMKDKEIERTKADITAGASAVALADSLKNTFGGSVSGRKGGYVSVKEIEEGLKNEFEDKNANKKQAMLETGAFVWDADSLHSDSIGVGGEGSVTGNTDFIASASLDDNSSTTANTNTSTGIGANGSHDTHSNTGNNDKMNRTRAESNLHLVLHRLVAIVKKELSNLVPDFASSILQPPNTKIGKKYYNNAIFKEHKEYFKKQMVKAEKSVHNHQFMGNYRPNDKLQYSFDRTYHKNNSDLINHQKAVYEPMTGKHNNLHGVHNWLSVLGKHDKYATTGRAAENAAKRLEKAFKDQGKWVGMQGKFMKQKKDRCLHLLSILEEEISNDEKREIEIYGLKGKEFKKRTRELVKERSETADRVMRIMTSYNLIPGVEVADYLSYTVELGRKCGVKEGKGKVKRRKKRGGGDEEKRKRREERRAKRKEKIAKLLEEKRLAGRRGAATDAKAGKKKKRRKKRGMTVDGKEIELSESESCSSTDSSTSESSESSSDSSGGDSSDEESENEKQVVRKANKNTNDGNAEYGGRVGVKKRTQKLKRVRGRIMSKAMAERTKLARHLSLHPKDPFVDTYKPHVLGELKLGMGKDGGRTINRNNSKRIVNNFKNAGWESNIRTGNSEKDHGQIPALLTLPDCYETGKRAGGATGNDKGDGERGGGEMEKSYLASKIMQDLRNLQVDKNTGALKRDAVPLYHRVSMDEGETYSDLVGRPFYYFTK